jgi:transcriptional regulator with XRE-family HTH domain
MGLMQQQCPASHDEKSHTNIVGPQIRKLRAARGWSQAKLAVRLQLNGLDIRRDVLAQMESQLHCIKDRDIPHFARALGANLAELFGGFGR